MFIAANRMEKFVSPVTAHLARAALHVLAVIAVAAPAPVGAQDAEASAPLPLLAQMEGRWAVEQTMWDGPGAPSKKGPPAIAVRRIPAGGGFVEEAMTASKPDGMPFTRNAHINYNVTARAFEYSSVDTRAPQQMHYRSQPAEAAYSGHLTFRGGTFVAVQWGGKRNVAFSYRVELSSVTNDSQRLEIFFRPFSGHGREFLATRYDYHRR